MTPLAKRLFEIAGSIRNFAGVADSCVITEVVNSIPAMRVWADELDEIRAALSPAELGGVAKVPLVQSTAPERIWLAVADDSYYADQPFPDGAEEVTWSNDAPLEVCVPYVRADISTPRAAEAVTVDQAMIERAVDACIQPKGRYSAYHAPETDDEWRAALTAALTPPSAEGE